MPGRERDQAAGQHEGRPEGQAQGRQERRWGRENRGENRGGERNERNWRERDRNRDRQERRGSGFPRDISEEEYERDQRNDGRQMAPPLNIAELEQKSREDLIATAEAMGVENAGVLDRKSVV